MASQQDSSAYWSKNISIIKGCLIVWFVSSFGMAILLRPLLSGIEVGGTDLGFWFGTTRKHSRLPRSDFLLRMAHAQARRRIWR